MMDILVQIWSWMWVVVSAGLVIGAMAIGFINLILLPLWALVPFAFAINLGEVFWKQKQ